MNQFGSSFNHVIKEAFIIFLGLLGFLSLWFKFFQTRTKSNQNYHDLQATRKDLEIYREKTMSLSKGISQKIDEQLELWKLSHAEKEIALLSLKGLANKEISAIRSTSEATIRQQMTSILKKSQLKSRSELSAFFLEDFLVLPASQ